MVKIYFETYGCSLNIADTEQMAGLLKEAKFEIVDNIEEANVIIFNTCTVKGPTENRFFRRLKEVEETYPYKVLIVAGCIAQTAPEMLKKYCVIGTKQIHNVVEVVEESINDNIIHLLDKGENPPLNLPRIKKNKIISVVPISRGCLGACTFCKTKQARGNLLSYSIEDIKKEVKEAVDYGAKEIWLTSQDTGCYGMDINTDLPTLLGVLVNISGNFKIRVGMMNPDHLLKIKDRFLNVFQDNKIFKFIHLPLQSGSDEVLKRMNRKYTAQQYKDLINEIKIKFDNITLATDIIVGFPGETEEQYWDTINLVRDVNFDVMNISRFWPRPKTAASKLKKLPGEVVKHRSRILTDISHNIFKLRNERWLDWTGDIIIDEYNKDRNQFIGRNFCYKPVIIENNSDNIKLGDVLKVKVNKVTTFDLRAKVI